MLPMLRPDDRRTIPFLDDARRNLAVVRRAAGPRSPTYRQLRRRYRHVADVLGVRRAFERSQHRLRRRRSRARAPVAAAAPGPLW